MTTLTSTTETPAAVVPPVIAPVVAPADKLFPAGETKEAPIVETPADKVALDAAKAKEAEEAAAKLKTEETAAAEKKAADEKAAKEYAVTAPDGVELDTKILTDFTNVSKEAGLTKEQAQKIVDFYGKSTKDKAAEQVATWETTNKAWVDQSKTDKEFGGTNFEASVGAAKQAISKFGSPAFNEALGLTGMGNHPEMIRFLVKVSKAFAEDKMVDGKVKPDASKDAAKLLFPNHN